MATEKEVDNLRAVVEKLTARPIDELVRNQAWGSINFDQAREALTILFGLSNQIKILPVDILPTPNINTFAQVFTESAAAVEGVAKFSLETANPTATRDALVTEVRRTTDQTLTVVQSWIPFLAYQRGDIQKNISDLSEAVVQAKGILAQALTDTKTTSGEIATIVKAARDASASAGVGVFTDDFAEQSKAFDEQANKWLIAAGVLAVATLGVSVASFWFPLPENATAAQVIQYMTSKIVLLGVLLTSTIWCGRLYKAMKHQAATNSHRANALKTFQAFIKATADDGTRNAVLLETTRSIFSHASTGYLDGPEAGQDGGTKILEIVKASSSAKGA